MGCLHYNIVFRNINSPFELQHRFTRHKVFSQYEIGKLNEREIVKIIPDVPYIWIAKLNKSEKYLKFHISSIL